MKVPGPHDGQVFRAWVTVPLAKNYYKCTSDAIESQRQEFEFLVNVFIFLFGGEDFLLLFLLSSVESIGDVDVGIDFQRGKIEIWSQETSLVNESWTANIFVYDEFFDSSCLFDLADSLRAVEVVNEDLHLVVQNILTIFFIN